jgi:hypothetical protein
MRTCDSAVAMTNAETYWLKTATVHIRGDSRIAIGLSRAYDNSQILVKPARNATELSTPLRFAHR